MSLNSVLIRVIPHEAQRYPTVGDWIFVNDSLQITVSYMGDDNYHMLIAVHEYCEALLCKKAGINEEEVTAFDKLFETWRVGGAVGEFDEPGNDPRAPYYEQHQTATRIEQKLALVLGVDWDAYDMAVNTL